MCGERICARSRIRSSRATVDAVNLYRTHLLLCALVVFSSCTTPPLETRPSESPQHTVIPTATAATRTNGIAPIAMLEGVNGNSVDAAAIDGAALSVFFSGLDERLHLARVFAQGDVQQISLQTRARHSPWGLGLALGPDGSRWIGLERSFLRVRVDGTQEEVSIPAAASRPPGLAAEGGRNGEVTAIFVDDSFLYLGRAGIPALTRVDLGSHRAVALALPPGMPDVGLIASGPGGDLYLAANYRSAPFRPEPTARLRLDTGQVEVLPFRGRPIAANRTWLAIATPDARFLDPSLDETRPVIPAARFDLLAFALLPSGEFVTVDPNDAALLFYDITGTMTRRVPFQAHVLPDGRLDRPPHFVVADGTAVWLVWGLDVFHVS
jgi:hypothetical protein